ncbi:MAG: hypothetical protein ACOCQY_02825 [Halorhabdus sp.]
MASAYLQLLFGVVLGMVLGVLPALVATVTSAVVPSLTDRRFTRIVVGTLSIAVVLVIGVRLQVFVIQIEQGPRLVGAGTLAAAFGIYGLEQGGRVGTWLRYRNCEAKTHGFSRGMKPTTGNPTTLQ